MCKNFYLKSNLENVKTHETHISEYPEQGIVARKGNNRVDHLACSTLDFRHIRIGASIYELRFFTFSIDLWLRDLANLEATNSGMALQNSNIFVTIFSTVMQFLLTVLINEKLFTMSKTRLFSFRTIFDSEI